MAWLQSALEHAKLSIKKHRNTRMITIINLQLIQVRQFQQHLTKTNKITTNTNKLIFFNAHQLT